ncbi:T6SS effector phospholipase Tle3 domain-containing protein [Enterobacter hormaechei]|uniref:T6SS effector phospholipase Tle3 domain-containing protein n=4 Tax=Enterobacter hormaechei TaxID=158836 RepID=UPI00223844AC|nr:contractile injection system protein, VgrG/Pvc8 family [Enterobacter hormaechei]MCW4908160.1 contractile injection system protein, VgrG/Pvc8 family [Enterobacter hormaechei subsp. xiangfangensis]
MSGESEVAQRQDTLNRYLLYFPRSKNVISDVHSFTGKEILSEPYRYTIRFTSPDLNIAINAVLNQRAEFILRAPNLEASWHGQTSWLPVRQINGTITQFSRLMSSGDEALYECVLEHELALLDQNYRSAVYMNMTVPELVTKLMKDSGHFDGYNIDFDQLSHSYPRREMIVQWKETDLRFIRRLLAEIGIWFRFENHNKVKTETVVIFGDSARRYNFSDKQMPYAGFASLHFNDGDFTHPIYENPHRIYQFFAAQRLADLIIQIRQPLVTQNDVINIVAHSQGTIITMLANMLVKQAGYAPVNCVILNHSPYSLESRVAENIQPGYQQTDDARQQTFKNFCRLMHTQWKGGGKMAESELQALEASCTLRKPSDNPLRTDDRYCRSNDGKVYNYFCPNDGVVSLENVQGFGWRGIPQNIASDIPNLFQRVFYQHGEVGNIPDANPFELPPRNEGDAKYAFLTNASYSARDVVINGEELPEPFIFKLQGEDNHPDNDPKTSDKPYTYYVDPDSPDAYISYSAKASAIKRTVTTTFAVNRYQNIGWQPGHVLSASELKEESFERKHEVIYGEVSGSRDFQLVTLTWKKTPEELQAEWQKIDPVGYSQHSSIVMSEFAPSHAMAFDLAIGQCKSFDYQAGKFWEGLLHRADWRDPQNGYEPALEYYRSGKLPETQTKFYMNWPDEVLPKGDYGVKNHFNNSTTIKPSRDLTAGNQVMTNLQWDMPKPKSESQLVQG